MCERHTKDDGSWWENDARGIPLCRVCDDCIEEKLSGFNPVVLSDRQRKILNKTTDLEYEDVVEEQIEPDEGAY